VTPRKPIRVEYPYQQNGNGTLLGRFERYGLPGLVIGVLFFFVWFNMNTANRVIEKNTEVMIEFKGAVSGMKDALRDNTSAVHQFREERRSRR